MPIELKHEVTILCEGTADQNFIKKLIEARGGFPPVDFLPPNEFHGSANFGTMLLALTGAGHAFTRIKGVLIVADSHDKPETTFAEIKARGFPEPQQPLQVAQCTAVYPAVAVMLIPDETTPGGLETLLARDLVERNKWIVPCVDAFLKCDQIKAHTWPPEKAGKARYHSIVAALNYDDPSRAASWAFRDPPVVSIGAKCFDSVEKRIKDFCTEIGVLH
jgi:hypothetical protein